MRYNLAALSLALLFYTTLATPVVPPSQPDAAAISLPGANATSSDGIHADQAALTGTLFLCQNLNCAAPCNSFNLATEIQNVCVGNSFPFRSTFLSIPAGETDIPSIIVGPLGCTVSNGLFHNVCQNIQGQSFSIFRQSPLA
ncbi:hypothetical protein C8Q77DRAFT_1161298 [Trametes polyzona]|nr:hypothetical protein C8Q77DRAFT_1161298 [Trametes polyzona]